MRDVDCNALLSRDEPDALVLAILCNFGGREPQVVVNHILSRLKQITGKNSKVFREYLDMLEILSDNRNLKPYIKEAEAMLTRVDVERLPSYELGMEKGLKKGLEKGGYQVQCRIARSLFGVLPDAVIADKTGLSEDELKALRAASE